MKALHRRSVTVALLAVFLVAVMVGTLLPPRVMAEVVDVLKGNVAHPDVFPSGCTICYDHIIPGHWTYIYVLGVRVPSEWIPEVDEQVCHYYANCPTP